MSLLARTRTRRTAEVGLHIAPLIDVVFLLLMYFMVATDFSPAEEVFRLELPPAAAGIADPLDILDEPLRVHLAAAGSSGTLARLTLDGPWPITGSPDGLRDFLEASITPQGSLFLPDHPIIIVPTGQVAWSHVVDTFNAAVAAGCTNVTLETPS